MSRNKIIGISGLLITILYSVSITRVSNPAVTFFSGTTVFPIFIALTTAIFSIMILLRDYNKGSKIEKLALDKKVLKTMGMCVVLFVAYTLIFEATGFIFSTILMLFGLLNIMNKGKLKGNIIISVVFPVIAYGVFAKLFSISLPPGLIKF